MNNSTGSLSREKNATQLNVSERKRIFDRTHLVLSPNHDFSSSTRLKFADEPQITAAILPPPPLPTNSTRRPNVADKNSEQSKVTTKQPTLNNSPSNETIVEVSTRKPTNSSNPLKPTQTTNDAGLF
jgi:hypothetical protein